MFLERFALIGFALALAQGDAHGAEGDGGGGAEGTSVFPPFDPSGFASQLLWLAISFGIFYLLMSRMALPRIGSILENRRDRISQDFDEAARLKEESDSACESYEKELAEARNRAHSIAREAQERAKSEADAKYKAAEAGLNEKTEQAEARIGSLKAKALSEVDSIASQTASAILQRLLGEKVGKSEIKSALSGRTRQERI